ALARYLSHGRTSCWPACQRQGEEVGIGLGGARTKTNKTAPRFQGVRCPQTRSIKHQRTRNGGPNGIRTRVSALRGPCPGPLDDGAVHRLSWLGEEDSNPRYQGQNLASYP